MSHFTTVVTAVTDLEIAKLAAGALGLVAKENDIIRGYRGNTQKADLVLVGTREYDAGLVKRTQDNKYDLVADWTMGQIQQDIGPNGSLFLQEYGFQTIQAQAKRHGHRITGRTTLENGIQQVKVRVS